MQRAGLTQVATYRRRVAASAERVWENVLDWEHLPYLHRTSFLSIALVQSGDWGWCARIGLHPHAEILLELRIDADRSRYVSRTLEGGGAGSEIWTAVTERERDATDIEVEFWLPHVAPENAAAIGAVYTTLYQRLWDEDESMMVRRAQQLATARALDAAPERVALGDAAALRAQLPRCIEWSGRAWRIVALDGELVVHASVCPHALGPLDTATIEAGAITCPWHGWRFDLRSGRALDGRSGRLALPPRIETDAAGQLWLVAPRS